MAGLVVPGAFKAPIHAGDLVAYPVRSGSSTWLTLARVKRTFTRPNRHRPEKPHGFATVQRINTTWGGKPEPTNQRTYDVSTDCMVRLEEDAHAQALYEYLHQPQAEVATA